MSAKKTMTLNLPEREMAVLEKMAKDMDMSKTGVMRQALRIYQSLKLRAARGEIEWDELFGLSRYRKSPTVRSEHAGDCNTRMADIDSRLKGCDCGLENKP